MKSDSRVLHVCLRVVFMIAVSASVAGGAQFSFRDVFNGAKDPAWNFYVPLAGPTESFDPAGFWTLEMPTTTTVFDHWSSVDNAPALYVDIPSANQADDFFIETHLIWDGPGSGNFHGVIVVYFSRYNTFYWGPYMSTNLRVEKSGQNALIDRAYSTRDVYLRIERTGNTYDFLYSSDPTSGWTSAGTIAAAETPTRVGLMGKTWGTLSQNLSLSFDYFLMNAALGASAGKDQRVFCGDKVTLKGSGPPDTTSFSWEQLPGDPRVTFTTPTNQAEVSFNAPTVARGTDLFFKLTVQSPSIGTSSDEVIVTVIPAKPPEFPPAITQIRPTDKGFWVLWQGVVEADDYDVAVEVAPGVWFTYATDLAFERDEQPMYEFRNLPVGTKYGVKIIAKNAKGSGAESEPWYHTIMRNLALPAPAGATPPSNYVYVVSHYSIAGMNNKAYDDNNDSWNGAYKAEDYWGYLWPNPLYFDRMVYVAGQIFWDGAWFTDLKLQYTKDGATWEDVPCVLTPPYDTTDSPAGRDNFARYDITFPVIRGRGIRIFGVPGGLATFTSIGELEVYGDQSTTNRPATFILAQGLDAEFNERTQATLDGSYSLSAGGNIVSYAWTAPAGFPHTLVGANSVRATFDAGGVDADVTYVFSLTVQDSLGNSNTDSDVRITIKNVKTTAVAGADRSVTEGDEVILSGQGSLSTSDNLTHHWTCVSHPDFQLLNPDNAVCTFTAPVIWNYRSDMTFRLEVNDLLGLPNSVSTDEVVISVRNSVMASVFDLEPFGAAGWQFYGSAEYDEGAGILKITPAINSMTGAAWLNETIDCSKFSAKFKIYIGDGSGADGMVFGWVRGPSMGGGGGWLGWYGGGFSGYGIVFDTYPQPGTNLVSFEDASIHAADSGGFASYTPPIDMENTGWFDVEVEMDSGHLQMWMSNEPAGFAKELVIDYTLAGYQGFPAYFGFTGATGGLNNNHWVDDLPSEPPDAYAVRDLPGSYQVGTTFDVKLSLRANPDALPPTITLRETIPAGTEVVDLGGGQKIGNEIGWSIPGTAVKTITYTLKALAGTTGGVPFTGNMSYSGVPEQGIYGENVIYEVPSAPPNLSVDMLLAAHLSWSASPQAGVAGYRIYSSVDGAAWQEIAYVTTTSYIDQSVVDGSNYRYKVAAVNRGGAEGPASPPTDEAMIKMLASEAEDFNYGGGLYPGPGCPVLAVEAPAAGDFGLGYDYFFQSTTYPDKPNVYRPCDDVDVREINPGQFIMGYNDAGNWWRYTFDVPPAAPGDPPGGWVKIVLKVAAPNGGVVEIYWDEDLKGSVSYVTGSWGVYSHFPMEEQFQTTAGKHTLRVYFASGELDIDTIGIGYNWTPPKRQAIFEDDFESYATLYSNADIIAGGKWTVQGTAGANGAWRLWITSGDKLGDESPDLDDVDNKYVITDTDLAGAVDADEQLITKEIDCTEWIKLRLNFDRNYRAYLEDTVHAQTADVDVRVITAGVPGSWVNLLHLDRSIFAPGTDPAIDSGSEEFDLSAYDGKKIQLRWHYYNANYDYWFAVDNVKLSGERKELPRGAIQQMRLVAGKVELSWSAFGTGNYTVECTDDIAKGDWKPVTGTWPSTQTTWPGEATTGIKTRFYRVRSQ